MDSFQQHVIMDSGSIGIESISGTVSASLIGTFTSSSGSASFTGAGVAALGLYAWSADSLSLRPLASEPTDSDGEAVIVSSSNTPGVLSTEAYGKVFNGTTWDRVRGNAASGTQTFPAGCGTASITTVSGQTASVVLKAANTARRGLTIFNSGTQPLYLGPVAGAGTGSFSVIVQPNAYWEAPFNYIGAVSGNWPAAGSTASIAEFA